MVSATIVQLFPNQVFDLPQPSSDRVVRTLSLTQVGMFRFHATGILFASDDPPHPALPGGGPGGGPGGPGGGGGGGGGGGSTPHRTNVTLDWTLTSPDGKTRLKPRLQADPFVVVTAAVLAQNRDPAGFSSRLWSLELALPAHVASINTIECSASIESLPAASQSPPPIVDVDKVPIGTGSDNRTKTFDFGVDRLGDLSVNVTSTPSVPIGLTLLDPANRTVATGTDVLTHAVTLADLHAYRGGLWHLQLTAPAAIPGGSTSCDVLVQVIDTLRIPASVLQPRFDALLRDDDGKPSFNIFIDYDDQRKNVVSIIISEELYFTLDAFGYLDNLEDSRLALDRRFNANAERVDLIPFARYPFMSFEGATEIHNLLTGTITAVVGLQSSPDGGPPFIAVTVTLIPRPNGEPTELHQGVGQTAEIDHATITVELYIGASEAAGITATATVTQADIGDNVPDWLADVRTDIQNTLQEMLRQALNGNVLQPVFTTLMGGQFTVLDSAWKDSCFEFRFIPPPEPAPHHLSPFYSARGTVAPGTAPTFSSPNLGKIDRIVVLMMENRSFDHVLGYLSLTGGRSDVDGLDASLLNSYDPALRPAPYIETRLPFDPDHSFRPVGLQMGNGGVGNQPMRGFVLSFLEKYPFMAFDPDSPQRKAQDDPFWYALRAKYTMAAIMGYHTEKTLPYYAFLAKEYLLCDRWYSSHPGPTFPNRFYYLGGQLGTDPSGEPQRDNDADSLRLLRARTVQDALTERGVPWKMYESGPDVCMLRMYARYAFDDTNIRPIEEFYAAARAGTLPSVTFLEPKYHIGTGTNDDHPPTDMASGQGLVQGVHDALTSNPASWAKTLLILTYDEHGGLHDHRLPDLADRYVAPGLPQIDIGYGVRVPTFIISPWVPAGVTTRQITQNVFDHTSILKTIVNRFCPNDPAILSDRMAFANDLFPLLTLETPRPPAAVATPSPAPPPIPTPSQTRAAARAMIAEARDAHAPLRRGRDLLGPNVDWHEYMTRLALMLR